MTSKDLNKVIDRMAAIKKEQDGLKAEYEELQAWLLTDAEDALTDTKRRSVSHTSAEGNTASVVIADTVSVTAAGVLRDVFGCVYPDMVKEEVKYTLKAPAKRILSAIWHKEYCEGSVAEIINGLSCDEKTKRVLMKKIKGIDFDKDRDHFIKIAGLSEEEASDLAYLANEAAAWENICTFVKVNHGGEISDEILADIVTKINAAVNVSRGMKVELRTAKRDEDADGALEGAA